MRVYPKSLSLLHVIVIKSNQGAEGAFQRMIIITEAEEEITFQPSDILLASV